MRVALASYRSKPHSGGQGIYVRNLSRELAALGHDVEVFSGPPYPQLDPGIRLTPLPSLDLYRSEDPFRRPRLSEFRDAVDVLEYAVMCSGGFPEPRTFSIRLARMLRNRISDFDVLHDNQTLGPGIPALADLGLPVVTTIHHPISRDRRIAVDAAKGWRKLSARRWYGFVAMQRRVARRSTRVLTPSQRSARDIAADFGVPPERIAVVPVGVDTATFRTSAAPRRPGRLVCVTSSDVPLKGLPVLLSAVAGSVAIRELIVVGRPAQGTLTAATGLGDRVRFVHGLDARDLAALMASAELAVVPSLYEGFSLPAVEAMACGTPVVASDVGALPELLGDGRCGLVVPAGDTGALGAAIDGLLGDPQRRARMGQAAAEDAVARYSWASVARRTAAVYAEVVPEAVRPAQAAA